MLRDTVVCGKITKEKQREWESLHSVLSSGMENNEAFIGRNTSIWSFNDIGKSLAETGWWFQICLFYYYASQFLLLLHKIFGIYHLSVRALSDFSFYYVALIAFLYYGFLIPMEQMKLKLAGYYYGFCAFVPPTL